MIGTLAVDGWAVTFGTARRGLQGGLSPLLDVPNVTAHPSTASVPSYHLILFDVARWQYNCQCPLKGFITDVSLFPKRIINYI